MSRFFFDVNVAKRNKTGKIYYVTGRGPPKSSKSMERIKRQINPFIKFKILSVRQIPVGIPVWDTIKFLIAFPSTQSCRNYILQPSCGSKTGLALGSCTYVHVEFIILLILSDMRCAGMLNNF